MLAPKHLQDSHLVVMMAKESYSFVIVTDVILMWNPIMLLLLLLCYCNDVPDNQHLMGGQTAAEICTDTHADRTVDTTPDNHMPIPRHKNEMIKSL